MTEKLVKIAPTTVEVDIDYRLNRFSYAQMTFEDLQKMKLRIIFEAVAYVVPLIEIF